MHTNRRDFLKLAGTAAAIGCTKGAKPSDTAGRSVLPSGSSSEDTGQVDDTGILDTGTAEDGPILADPGYGLSDAVPSSLGTSSYGDDDLSLSVISGEMPADIHGHYWLVHPYPPGGGNPLFVGSGRVIRIDLSPTGVEAKLRMARTPCHYADVASEGTSFGFNNQGLARMSMQLGVRNLANTAFVCLDDDRVILTYDGGRPFELNPAEATVQTAVGWNSEWVGAMPTWMDWVLPFTFPMVMSTAHPAVDGDTLFTVEYNLAILGSDPWIRVAKWNGSGELNSWAVLDESGSNVAIEQSVHQMVATEDFIVIVDTAFVVEVEGMFGDSTMRTQSPETVIWIIKREDLQGSVDSVTAKRIQVPLEVIHLTCDRANPDGEITLHVSHTPGTDASEFIEPGDVTSGGLDVRVDLHGLPPAPSDLGALGRIKINGNSGTVLEHIIVRDERLWGGPALATQAPLDNEDRLTAIYWSTIGMSPELRLARVDSAYSDHPYRHVPLSDVPSEVLPSTLVRVDPAGPEIVDSWSFPVGRIVLSPQWVPGGSDGYLVTTMISDDRDTAGSSGCEIWIFDCANLAQGPLARLGHTELNFPFTLHTTWTETAGARTASYQVNVRTDTATSVARQSTEIQTMFETSVYPHFE